MTSRKKLVLVALAAQMLCACSNQAQKGQTLADIDVPTRGAKPASAAPIAPDTGQVKSAYYDYLQTAEADDQQRAHAALRIAELELSSDGPESDAEFESNVRNAISVLQTALQDFPDAQDNDRRWYQLAKAYDQLGEAEQAIATLTTLVNRYPDTPYYVEAQFRLAEHAFINGEYARAESGYSDILDITDNQNFIERALFKRGWARFKQEEFTQALDDFFAALDAHGFVQGAELSKGESELLQEYMRATALSFLYLGGEAALAEHFADKPDDPYTYRTYAAVSDLLLQQERYSDAVATLNAYSTLYPYGEGVMAADLQALTIWKDAHFRSRFESAFADFYTRYRPKSPYWQQPTSKGSPPVEALRENLLVLASRYHNKYLKDGQQASFQQAEQWYERYLESFSNYARQDQIYPQYARLLERQGLLERAFSYYQLAAFDGDIVLDKSAAYAGIYLSDRLYEAAPAHKKAYWLEQHLNNAQAYAQLYPKDPRSVETVQHAVQLAFKNGRLTETVALANLLPDAAPPAYRQEIGLLKAQALFDLESFEEAELVYQDLLLDQQPAGAERKAIVDKLALSIYQQGEAARGQDDELATLHFLRLYQSVPESELAATALYDAAALLMATAQWEDAIHYLNVFSKVYPTHKLHADVGKKLSVAYLQADRKLEAAQAFESLARTAGNEEEKMAALWQAAELYSSKNDTASAIRTYETYASRYKRPYPQYVEAMHRLADLYAKDGSLQGDYWLEQIVQQDSTVNASLKTDRTEFLAAGAAFALAKKRLQDFDQIALVHPLAQSLKQKKVAMQGAVKLFGQASAYGHREYVTESTYHIATIYRSFAKALLNSERPSGLTDDELEQYNILLEDQAFPFEDQAIDFFETNLGRIAEGVYDDWLRRSLAQLVELFPARYGRTGKAETSVEQL